MLLESPAQVHVNDPFLWDPSPGNQKGKQILKPRWVQKQCMMVFILSFIWKQNMNFLTSIHITAVAFLLTKTNCNNMSGKLRPKIQICCVVLFKKNSLTYCKFSWKEFLFSPGNYLCTENKIKSNTALKKWHLPLVTPRVTMVHSPTWHSVRVWQQHGNIPVAGTQLSVLWCHTV